MDEEGIGRPEGFFDHRISFVNAAGEPSSPLEMVVPIGFFDPKIDLIHPFGTGVFISEVGLLCTARHVFEFEDSFLETMRHLSDRAYPAIYQYYDNHTANMRPIVAAHGHPRFDVAVARVQPFHNLETGEPFKNKMLALTTDIMSIETRVHQYSYSDPVVLPSRSPVARSS